jgi:hypothetical protein
VRPLSRVRERPALRVRLTSTRTLPPGWSCEDSLGLDRRRDEYVPASEAAARMGLTLAEVEGLAVKGWLDAHFRRDGLWVRPVVLSRLGVHDPGVEPPEPARLPGPELVPSDGTERPAAAIDLFGRVSS